MSMQQWFLIENETDYKKAITRYEEVREDPKGTNEYKEWLLLAHLISKYELEKWDLPDLDPIEFIKVRMEDFGYSAADLRESMAIRER
jgi:HTH-type transcriptional regulator/antitoxin HigA